MVDLRLLSKFSNLILLIIHLFDPKRTLQFKNDCIMTAMIDNNNWGCFHKTIYDQYLSRGDYPIKNDVCLELNVCQMLWLSN